MTERPDRRRPSLSHQSTARSIPRREALQALLGGVGAGFALTVDRRGAAPGAAASGQPGERRAGAAEGRGRRLHARVPRRAPVEDPRSARRGHRPRIDHRAGRAVSRSAARRRVGAEPARVSRRARRVRHGRHREARQGAGRRSRPPSRTRCCARRRRRTRSPRCGGHFQNLKGWIAGAYYSSEPGMRELGWTGNVFLAELPGCTHPGGHQA